MNIEALPFWAMLPLLAGAAFIQNMAFTAVSRSRNAGDVAYHRRTAWASNGVWYVTQLLIMGTVWPALTSGSLWKIAVVGVVYIAATTEGSCLMMEKLLRSETGKRQVGAR